MTPLSAQDFSHTQERFEKQMAEAEARRTALDDVASSVLKAKGRSHSTDGSITVTAGTDGAITEITLTDEALNQGARALAQSITTAIAAAQRNALEQAASVSSARLGDHHPLVAELRHSAERFAGPDDQLSYK